MDDPEVEVDDVLGDADSKAISFSGYPDGVCRFDLRVTAMDGRAWTASSIDLCATIDLELTLRGGELQARPPGSSRPSTHGLPDRRDFILHNKLGFFIKNLNVSETNSSWEEDVLGDDVLAPDDAKAITFSGYGDGVCEFDIRLTDLEDNTWTVSNVDLCTVTDLDLIRAGSKVTSRATFGSP